MSADRKRVSGACPHDCPDQCAWHVTVEDGRAVAVTADATHPFTAGALCTKLKHYAERIQHSDRIVYPLKRIGRKGAGAFERVSWHEAIAAIAARMRSTIARDGGASILPYSFAGTIGLLQRYAGSALFRHLGATACVGDWCGAVAHAGVAATNGNALGVMPEELAHSRLIVLWGTNTAVTNLHAWSGPIRTAQRAGARVVVIDPVRTRTAERADEHLQIAPGTDAALALALIHVIVRDGLVDHDYVRDYTVGYAALVERVNAFPPARVAALTRLDEARIEALAHALAKTRPAAIRLLIGMERHANGAEAYRAIACLPALTGAWRDRGGGLCHFTVDLFRPSLNYAALSAPERTPEPPRTMHIAQLGQALTTLSNPGIDTLVVYNANPVVAAPNQNLVLTGLAREDLCTVVIEHFMTDTARYADYVLPATMQPEHLDLMASWGSPYITLNRPAAAPRGEALPNTEIFRRLARALDTTEPVLLRSDEALVHALLDSDHPYLEGIDFARLERDGWARMNIPDGWRPYATGGFATPSGKCEFYSQAAADSGADPLPAWTPPPTAPSAWPLRFIAAKTAVHALNSQYVHPGRGGRDRTPVLEIHPHDAAARGIDDGDTVRVLNERGSVSVRAHVAPTTPPGCVSMPFNCWPRDLANNSSANALTADGLSALGIGSDACDACVEVVPAATA